jgi:two-component system sensor histidine kinase PilS (NtrC family)
VPLRELPTPLRDRLAQWHADPAHRTDPFRATTVMPQLQANFTRLEQDQGDLTLIFIDDMSKVTQQAQQMKLASLGRLTAGIAHEIRNPLGAISHAAQLLGESSAIEPNDVKMVDMIQRHSVRVNNIVENILDLSRRRQADMEVIDVGQWLTEFVADYRDSLAKRPDHPEPDIQVHLPRSAPPARFDRSQLEQVLVNLCDNGLRHSEAHTGQAVLAITVAATGDGERCYVDITDNGPGIPAEQRQNIFEPFFTTDKGGTGLGLYLARELCEANQAQLSLLESAGEGCCFRITFAHHGRLI